VRAKGLNGRSEDREEDGRRMAGAGVASPGGGWLGAAGTTRQTVRACTHYFALRHDTTENPPKGSTRNKGRTFPRFVRCAGGHTYPSSSSTPSPPLFPPACERASTPSFLLPPPPPLSLSFCSLISRSRSLSSTSSPSVSLAPPLPSAAPLRFRSPARHLRARRSAIPDDLSISIRRLGKWDTRRKES